MPARDLDPVQARAVVRHLHAVRQRASTDTEAAGVAAHMRAIVRRARASQWEPYPWQRPHLHPADWVSTRAPGVCDERCLTLPYASPPPMGAWLQRGGRGTGKTDGAAHYVNTHAEGPACDPRVPGGHRFTIVAPTQADAVTSCVTGVSGLQAINPAITIATTKEGTLARWPNGAVARVVGANSDEDLNRLRAWSNICLAWVEEAAAMRRLGGLPDTDTVAGVMDQLPFTMRLGEHPHMVITTTPKNRPEVVALIGRYGARQTWGRTRDADRLAPVVRQELETRYGGTTAGAQELDGDLIPDVEGALWVQTRPALVDGLPNPDDRPGIDNDKVDVGDVTWVSHNPDAPAPVAGVPTIQRTIIAVDPPGGRTECGIVVVGRINQTAYVLADLSMAGPPDSWATAVIRGAVAYGCEGIAAEHAYGGDMVTDVIGTRMQAMVETGELASVLPIFRVPTKVGKRLRAEPVSALYQQHRVRHLRGALPGLEAEQRTWVPGEGDSPNRVDALVHGVTHLLIRSGPGRIATPSGGQRIASSFGPR